MRTHIAAAVLLFAILSAAGAGAAGSDGLTQAWTPQITAPGRPLQLIYQCYSATGDPVVVRFYALPVDDAVDLAAEKRRVDRDLLNGLSFVTEARSAGGDAGVWSRREVQVNGLPAGQFVADATIGNAESVSIVNVSSFGIVYPNRYYNERGEPGVYYPADVRTFDRYPGRVELRVRDDLGERALAMHDGLALLTGRTGDHAVLIARAADGSSVTFPLSGASPAPDARETGFIQMDRPVYRPGDTVRLRAIVRKGSIGAYAIPTGTRSVKVRAPDGTVIFDHDLPLSSFGTINASVRLPADAATGNYSLEAGVLRDSILVSAYKKPEYVLDVAGLPRHVVGGDTVNAIVDARYFFGRPAAGMHVHYTATAQSHWYPQWFGPWANVVQSGNLWNGGSGDTLAQGDATTDEQGRVTIAVPTKAVDSNQDVGLRVEARDDSGRTVSTTASVFVTTASFQVSVQPDSWFYRAGAPAVLSVHARSFEGEPRPGARVSIAITGNRWDAAAGRSVPVGGRSFDVQTDARGDASLSWTPPSGGDYLIVASAKDERGRTSAGESYVWALAPGEDGWFAPMSSPMLVPEKSAVAPGTRAKLLIAMPQPDRDVVILTSTDRLHGARVVHVAGMAGQFSVDVPADAEQFRVTALLPGERGVTQSMADLTIAPSAKRLHVAIVPRKARYLPGERATFDVRVRDAAGRPLRAELGIGVVDEAIYSVQAERPGDPLDAFYAAQWSQYYGASWLPPVRALMTIAKVNAAGAGALVKSGTTADVYSINAGSTGAEAASPVRSNFADTAYWTPSIVTDASGLATLSFVWPDDLTTWRATGVAVSQATDVGEGTGSALVTKDFLVRLETPRFLRAGDRSTIVGIAHGTADRRDVRVQLDAAYLSGDPLRARSIVLDRFQTASASWPVSAPGVGTVALTLSGSDGARSDAMRRDLPLEAGTAAEHVRDAGSFAARGTLVVRVPPGYLPGDVHLTLSPSLIGELVQNQRLLDVYPYGCTEQTMSTALPDVFIDRVMKREGIAPPQDVAPAEIVAHAIARLAQLQHADGAWGWWEHDAAHPFMTAYAVYGLAEFKKDGYPVPDEMFARGVDSLVSQLGSTNGDTLAYWGGPQPDSAWNTRAFMLFALASAAPGRVDRSILDATFAHAAQLNPYALSVLGLAERTLGNARAARGVLAVLDRAATDDGHLAYWLGQTWDHRWMDDPIESTAYALRLESALAPDSPRVDRTVAFLRSERRGDWWYTTKDTAAAIYALSETTAVPAGSAVAQTVRVLVDGKIVRTLHVTGQVLDAADAGIVIPAATVHDGMEIRFERTGHAPFYWSSDAVRYVPPSSGRASDAATPLLERAFAKPASISIERTYAAGHPGPWRVGDEVAVEVTVRSREDQQYVALEDPFPAGAEHQPEQGRAADDAWNGLQLLDDRAVFFADRLPANVPLIVRYTLRVTTPGTYVAPATSVYAMYGPPVSALGRAQSIEVVR